VPRGTAEGCGYLLAVVYRGAEKRSDLLVLDAEDVAAGPLAVAALETRVPFGFHGNWMPAAASA
jgi:carotenoid cleavage dioxygenase